MSIRAPAARKLAQQLFGNTGLCTPLLLDLAASMIQNAVAIDEAHLAAEQAEAAAKRLGDSHA